MHHSTVTAKGQTTIPGPVRNALGIRPGSRLEYEIEGNQVIVRVHPGAASLAGSLASSKGKGLSFAKIRQRAAAAAVKARR